MMSISFSQASSARIEASRLDGDANRVASIQNVFLGMALVLLIAAGAFLISFPNLV